MATNFPSSLDSYATNVDGVDIVTAADINNLQDAVVAIETAVGVGMAQPTATAGTADALVKRNSSGLLNKYGTLVYGTGTITIGNNAWTAVTFAATRFLSGTMWAIGQPTRILLDKTGIAMVSACIGFPASATGERGIAIRVDGATYIARDQRPATSNAMDLNICTQRNFANTNYVEIMVYQNSGSPMNLVISSFGTPEAAVVFQ